MRWRTILVTVIGLAVLLPIAAIGIFILPFDPDAWKPRIQDAVMRATGRQLSLNGPISLKWSLVPTIEARDVALANIDGGSRPQMLTAQSIEAEVALLPLLLHRIEIPSLVVIRPDVLIETSPAGRGNWVFAPPTVPATLPAAAPATAQRLPIAIAVASVTAEDGRLAWRDGLTGQTVTATLNSLDLQAPGETSPMSFRFVATYAGTRFEAKGETGSTARLFDGAANDPWPVKLAVNAATTAALLVDGQFTTPLDPLSFSGKASGKLTNLALLQPFIPGVKLPSAQGLSFSVSVSDSGPPLTRISDFTPHAEASDLSAYVPGLTLTDVDIRAPQRDQPITLQAAGNYAGAPLSISARLGSPGALVGGQAFPVDASFAIAGATATAKGTLADPANIAGAELVVSARIPKLAPFAALLRRPLPDARNLAFDARLGEAPGGFAKGIALRQATLTLPQGDIAGDVSLEFTRPPSITGNVTSRRVDLDALLEMPWIDPPAPRAAQQAGTTTATPPPSQPRGNPNLLFSDASLDFGALRHADADARLHIDELATGGETHRDIDGHFVLKDGKLVLDPISGLLPAGRMSGRLTIDANPPQPPVTLVLRAPGLSVRGLALMLGLPSDASGSLEVDANLNGAGDSLHAIAAGLNGTLGLAMVNGQIDNGFLNRLLGPILTSASLPLSLIFPGRIIGGNSSLRCFAARLEARDGLATFRALYLNSARLKVTGSGTINLGDETIAMRLRPLERLADTGITVPLILGGTIEHPQAHVDAFNTAEANILGLARSARDLAELPLNAISDAIGRPDLAGRNEDHCVIQLAIARGGPGGPQPNSPPSILAGPAGAARQILNAPRDLLKDLIGK